MITLFFIDLHSSSSLSASSLFAVRSDRLAADAVIAAKKSSKLF